MDVDNGPTPAALKYPTKIPFNIASLEYLATTSLALDLWHRNQSGHFPMPRANFTAPNFNCEKSLRISLPPCVMTKIDKRIRSVGPEVHFLYNIFYRFAIFHDKNTFLKYFDDLTYGPDGEMCPERTAKNLITRNDLIQWQKFKIACVYWMEEEIRQIWPTVADHPDLAKFDTFGSFVRYWIMEMRNGGYTNTIPFAGYSDLERMFRASQHFGNWTAGMNVLNKLRADEQDTVIKSMAAQKDSGFKNLLPKLNEIQVDHVLSTFPLEIITGLALQKGGFEYAIKIWNIIRDTMRKETFDEIFRFLRRRAYDADKYKFSFLIRTQAQAVLLEMWNTASDRLKMVFLKNERGVERLFRYLSEIDTTHYHRLDNDINFISKLFFDLPMKMRSRIWRKYWHRVVFFSPPKILDRLLSLGLTNSDYSKFVEEQMLNYTNVGFIMRQWLKGQFFNTVINYTKFCSWNEKLVREFRKQIFIGCIPSSDHFRFEELINLGIVIDNNLPNVEAKEAKRTILFSFNVQRLFGFELEKGLAKEAIWTVDSFLPTERSVREKEVFLDHWCKFLNFAPQRWKEFLSWWVDNENDLPGFKEFLPVDQIFEELFLKVVSMMVARFGALEKEIVEPVPSSIDKLQEFAETDEFFMWYFGNEEAAKNFKRNKISNYENISELNNLLSINNESILNCVIAWFFDGNLDEMGDFKKKFYGNNLPS